MENDDYLILILDEVGFGTKPLRHYAYSKIGEPAILETKYLAHNLTCTATISDKGVELLKFFFGEGTKNEYFADYFSCLLHEMT